MSDTVNAVVNNLAERIGEAADVIGPTLNVIGEISATVVQETARCGFIYTMAGLAFIIIGGFTFWLSGHITDRKTYEMEIGLLIIVSVISAIIGILVVLGNMSSWFAPTNSVVHQMIDKFQ